MAEMTPQRRGAQTRRLRALREEEEARIVDLLQAAGTYSESLAPLIDTYLDAHVIYKQMYEEWRDEGFPATKLHVNKSGHENEIKHPLAQQVADWNAKKSKLIEQLGLTPKLQKIVGGKPNGATDKLQEFTEKWGGGS